MPQNATQSDVQNAAPAPALMVVGNEAKGTYQGNTLAFKSGMNVSEFARHNSLSMAKAEEFYVGFRRLCWLAFQNAAQAQKIVSVRHGAKWDRSKKAWIATTTLRHEGGRASKELAAIAYAKTKSQTELNLASMADALAQLD